MRLIRSAAMVDSIDREAYEQYGKCIHSFLGMPEPHLFDTTILDMHMLEVLLTSDLLVPGSETGLSREQYKAVKKQTRPFWILQVSEKNQTAQYNYAVDYLASSSGVMGCLLDVLYPLELYRQQQFELSLLETTKSWDLFSGSEVPFEAPLAPFSASHSISNVLAWDDFTSFPASFELSDDVDFTDFSALGKAKRSHDTVFEHLAAFGVLNQEASSTDLLAAATQLKPRQMNDCGFSSSTDNSMLAFTAETSTQAEQNTLPSQEPSTFIQPKQPSRNTDEKLTCSHIDCKTKELIFPDARAWTKHKNKHTRPFRCTIANCTRTQGFASKGDQLRHERSVHKMGTQSADIMLFCDEPDCERGPGAVGFARRDNLIDHMKRRHGRVLPPVRTAVNDSMLPDTQAQTENQEVGSAVMVPESQKRTASKPPETFDIVNIRARKRLRTEICESSCEVERTPLEEALSREVEQLRRELEKAQKEKDVLIGVIGQLTQGQK